MLQGEDELIGHYFKSAMVISSQLHSSQLGPGGNRVTLTCVTIMLCGLYTDPEHFAALC